MFIGGINRGGIMRRTKEELRTAVQQEMANLQKKGLGYYLLRAALTPLVMAAASWGILRGYRDRFKAAIS